MSFLVHPSKVVEKGWAPETMRLSESLMSLGNGYMGLRGNFEEDYSGDSHRGTYLGGVWFPDKTRVGWWKNGYPPYFGKVINAVNLIGIRASVDGEPIDLARMTVWEYTREVDMRTGVLSRVAMVETNQGTLQLACWRFVSLARKELLAVRYTLTSSFAGHIELTPYLDADVRNLDANYDEQFWDLLDGGARDGAGYVTAKTKANPFGTPRFTVCAAMAVRAQGLTLRGDASRKGYCESVYAGDVEAGQTVTLDKFSLVFTSRDHAEETLQPLAWSSAQAALREGWEEALYAQKQAWAERWAMADVLIEGDDGAQQGIRFNLFQLLSTYTGEDARLNIGPKGFTGEKYGGATYWDTEAYCLPVYLSISGQKTARQLLLYRYQQLDGAYQNARRQGLPGALYPMVTFTGEECHNEWEITFEELHRNAAIAYAIYNYTTYTGDESYARGEGLAVLLGIARFWAGRVHRSARTGQYMIHGVTGPNEYENNVNNNWYTNRMAAWCLTYFLKTAKAAGESRIRELGVTREEMARMREIADGMYLPEDERLGIFVQHDTFLDKELRPASEIPEEERPINQHWSWDRILRSCYIKQADVLQGLYFLNDLYDLDTIRRNFDFYEPMTVHESSLSPCVHCILAAQLGYRDKAVALYKRTARLDLDNINRDTQDGLHVTSMAGSWLAIAQGFAGMRTARGLSFAPFLPDCWKGYAFKFNYRGRVIELSVRNGEMTLALLSGDAVDVTVYGKKFRLAGRTTLPLQGAEQSA